VEEIEATLRVGYNRRSSNDFLPIHECPILSPLLWRAAESLLQMAATPTAVRHWAHGAVEVEFFCTDDEKSLQMTIFVRKAHAGFIAFCEQLQKLLPELKGATVSRLPQTTPQRQVRIPRPLESWGTEGLSYHVAEEKYWVSRSGFFQVNRYLLDELVRIVTAGRHGKVAWDLYAGVGLFSHVLTRTFLQVVAVEAAGDDLLKSFKGPGRRAVKATTAEFLRHAVLQRERPELIVVDPPRAGCGEEVCSLLARISPPEIIYVSCDPLTLARDLKHLTDAGYEVSELHMADMFPQTFHLESVAVLRK
jgi:23S rRNA (uracil1939-C5)-methyltransferase